MPSRAHLKLGKLPPRHDLRTIHFGDLLDRKKLPAPPLAVNWDAGLPANLGMMCNADIGCCGFSGQGHAVQTWTTRHCPPTVTVSDDAVKAAYAGCTGWDPNDPSTDQGVVLLSALRYWQKVGIGGHRIGAYAKVDHHNLDHVKLAIDLFGSLYVGVSLPISAQEETTWVAPTNGFSGDNAPGSWGGHCISVPSFSHAGFTCVTWGARQDMTAQWWLDYVDEAWVCLTPDWIDGTRPAPNGFDLARLQSLLTAL